MLATLALAAALAVPSPVAPETRYDPRIPTLKDVVGHDLGGEITSPDQIAAYLKALAAAAPDRARVVEYARSEEGRPLHVLVIGSPERLARLEDVKKGLRALADPRGLAPGEAERLVKELPAVVWLLHAVHGNEISSPDAALALAHHLLAAQGDETADLVRREAIVLVDPLQNPDGRARFLATNRLGRAASPDPEPASAEHDEGWPGGRSNHYLFDMNRDWFAQAQPETRGRLRLFLEWYPHVTVDLHEMGGDSTYFFAPPAKPLNPQVTRAQQDWHEAFGRAIAARFDAAGQAYFVREVFDSFYPGYGETWPLIQGSIGMTFEQASARGLVFRREDDTELTFLDGIHNHFRAALATVETAARGREKLLRDFLEFRRSAVSEGELGAVRQYVIAPGRRPGAPRAAGGAPRRAGDRGARGRGGGPGRDAELPRGVDRRAAGAARRPARAEPPGPADLDGRGVREGAGPEAEEAAAGRDLRRDGVEPPARVRPGVRRRRGAGRRDAPLRPGRGGRGAGSRDGEGGLASPVGLRHGGGRGGGGPGRAEGAGRRGRPPAGRPCLPRRHRNRPRGREPGRRARDPGAHRPAAPRRGRGRGLRVHRGGRLPRQRARPPREEAAGPARVGPADLEPLGGLGALGAGAPLRPAGHGRPRLVLAARGPRALRRADSALRRLRRDDRNSCGQADPGLGERGRDPRGPGRGLALAHAREGGPPRHEDGASRRPSRGRALRGREEGREDRRPRRRTPSPSPSSSRRRSSPSGSVRTQYPARCCG